MKKIEVTFIDDLSGNIIGQVELSPESLPPSFVQDTTLFIDEADWAVVESIPVESVDFIAQGSLTLRLRKVQKMDPANILFSVPTLCEALPSAGGLDSQEDDFRIAEDDWRQIECISTAHLAFIGAEMASVLSIHEHASKGAGWENMHMRKEPTTGIVNLPLKNLTDAFGEKTKGLSFGGQTKQIENGFSIECDSGFHLYGLLHEDNLSVLALDAFSSPDPSMLAKLKEFLDDNELVVVDWCRCTQASGDSLDVFFSR